MSLEIGRRGALVVAAYCEDLPSEDDAERAIAEIARQAMIAAGILTAANP